jgi:hypothetical protein
MQDHIDTQFNAKGIKGFFWGERENQGYKFFLFEKSNHVNFDKLKNH